MTVGVDAAGCGVAEAGALDAGALEAGALEAGALEAGALEAAAVDVGALDVGAPEAVAPATRADSLPHALDASAAAAAHTSILDRINVHLHGKDARVPLSVARGPIGQRRRVAGSALSAADSWSSGC